MIKHIKFNETDYKQKLVDYINSVSKVNAYAYAITQQSIPQLSQPTKNYADFTKNFVPAKAHCLEWTGGIFPTMISFPKIIVSQTDKLFNLEESMALAYLKILEKDPQQQDAKIGLNDALTDMQTIIKEQISTANSLLESLNKFSTNIVNDSAILNDIATKALEDVTEDKEKINKLNEHINNLYKDIDTYQTLLTISQIGTCVSIFVGLIGIACCVIPGAQGVGIGLIVIAVVGEAASIVGWILSQKKIDDDRKFIEADQKEIKDINQDIILLQGINISFENLVESNTQAIEAIKVIINMWQELDNDIEIVKNDLTKVDDDVAKEEYAQARNDLQQADNAWKEVVKFAKDLAEIDYKWQDKDGNWHNYNDKQPKADSAEIDLPKEKIS